MTGESFALLGGLAVVVTTTKEDPPHVQTPTGAPPESGVSSRSVAASSPARNLTTSNVVIVRSTPAPGTRSIVSPPSTYRGPAIAAESRPFTTDLDHLLGGNDLPADVFSWSKPRAEATDAGVSNALVSGRPIFQREDGFPINPRDFGALLKMADLLDAYVDAYVRFQNAHARIVRTELGYAAEMFRAMRDLYADAYTGAEITPQGRHSLAAGAYVTGAAVSAFKVGGKGAVAAGVTSVMAGGSFYAGAAAVAGVSAAAFPAAVIAAAGYILANVAVDIYESLRNPFSSREFRDAPRADGIDRGDGVRFGSRAISVYYGTVLSMTIRMVENRIAAGRYA